MRYQFYLLMLPISKLIKALSTTVFFNRISTTIIGIITAIVLHQYNLSLSTSSGVGSEDAEVTIMYFWFHRMSRGLNHKHIPIESSDAFCLNPSQFTYFLTFTKITTGGLE